VLRIKLNTQVSGVPEYRADLADSHAGLGSVFRAQGKRTEAIAEMQQCIDVWVSLFKDYPDLPDHRHSFASNANALAVLLRQDGKLDEARQMHALATETCEALVEAAPTKRGYQYSLSSYYHELCRTAANQKDHAALALAASRMAHVQLNRTSDPELAARYLGHCSGYAEQDPQLADADRRILAQSYADQAMDQLREAVRRGYKDSKSLKTVSALAPLRERADFKQLIAELDAR
jgi:tetratricopeptide (TPR) repeat protein